MRYFAYLFLLIVAQVVAWIITSFLPAFAVRRDGPIDNANGFAIEPRLPWWLAAFDTPDNSLLGDANWKASHDGGYWSMVAWLYRNSLYGFKWSAVACRVEDASAITFSGDPRVNRNNGITGLFRASLPGGYWQWKLVANDVSPLLFAFGSIACSQLSLLVAHPFLALLPLIVAVYLAYVSVQLAIGKGLMWNFGWQLDEFVQSGSPGVALFQFSPRIVSIQ